MLNVLYSRGSVLLSVFFFSFFLHLGGGGGRAVVGSYLNYFYFVNISMEKKKFEVLVSFCYFVKCVFKEVQLQCQNDSCINFYFL